MADHCYKCKKPITSKERKFICNTDDCLHKCHRSCANIDEAIYDAISKNEFIKFKCGECNDRFKVLTTKMYNLEDKINRLCLGMNQLQTRMFQQLFHQNANIMLPNGNNNFDVKKMPNNLMVVGCNVTSDRLKVICDFGRWAQVGKFSTSTTEEDIIDYLAEELKMNKNQVKCTKLVKNDANLAQLSYCKFKISIPDHRFNDLFNETVWPSGVMVSPFMPRSQLNTNRI